MWNGPWISPLGTPSCGRESGPSRYWELGCMPAGGATLPPPPRPLPPRPPRPDPPNAPARPGGVAGACARATIAAPAMANPMAYIVNLVIAFKRSLPDDIITVTFQLFQERGDLLCVVRDHDRGVAE